MGVVIFGILAPRQTHSTIKYQQNISPYVVAITPAEISKKKVLYGSPIYGNCVKYARSVRPDLPQGLFTLESKKRIAKKKNPEVGDVAVTAESYAGHLAVILKVEKEHILIRESGYTRNSITTRWIPRTMPLGFF